MDFSKHLGLSAGMGNMVTRLKWHEEILDVGTERMNSMSVFFSSSWGQVFQSSIETLLPAP